MEFDVTNVKELYKEKNIGINIDVFDNLTNVVIKSFDKLGINLKGMLIYYQRYSYSSSVLAVKVLSGDDSDINNYMVNGCSVSYNNDYANCNVYLHSLGKNDLKLVNIANLISNDIVTFFEDIEQELVKKKLTNLEVSFVIPLDRVKDVGTDFRESNLKKKMRSIFKR